MPDRLAYPNIVLPRLRYQFCPMCTAPLTQRVIDDDAIPRIACPACGWVHYPTNAMGVNLIIKHPDGIVALLPPNLPEEAPAALPGGHAEYAESPEQAAVREAFEETGLIVEVVRCLGWYFDNLPHYPGPILSFIFECQVTGGTLKASQEGAVSVFPLDRFPPIHPSRWSSKRTMEIYRQMVE